MILILIQLALLLCTAWGWGFWLWKLSKKTWVLGSRRYHWFFLGLAGYESCNLFLQALIYFDLPLRLTSWAGLCIAAAGIVASLSPLVRPSTRIPLGALRRRETSAAVAVFVVVFFGQGVPLFRAGPDNYYGNAHIDQINYVLLAEFLAQKPFSTSIADVQLQPWLAKPILLKESRIGQSVANGYLGVISLSDAKRAYGTLSIFVVSLGALSVFILARVLSVPRTSAFLLGAWWGFLPAITKMHLDGFFSQASVIFVFPMLAALFCYRRERIEIGPYFLLTISLAYLLCVYTEMYILGVSLFACLVLLAAKPGTRFAARVLAIIAVVIGSLLLSGKYAGLFLRFAASQYAVAGKPSTLANLAPMSGTWTGWQQIFFGYQNTPGASIERAYLLTGMLLVLLVVCAFQGWSQRRRWLLLAMIAPALGVLTLLLSAPELPKYAFSKLLDTFTTFWLVLAIIGLLRFGRNLGRRFSSGLAVAASGLMASAAVIGSWPQWVGVCHGWEGLSIVDSPVARRCYALAEAQPADIYVVAEQNCVLCAWLCYAARRSSTYVDAVQLTDLPVPAELYAFRAPPPFSQRLVMLGPEGPKRLADHQNEPDLSLHNPQGAEGSGVDTWYWVGQEAAFEIMDYSVPQAAPQRYTLEFRASAGPANPSPARELALVDPAGGEQRASFNNEGICRFEVNIHPGKTRYILKILSPEQTVTLASDSRDLMVRIDHLGLSKLPGEPQIRAQN